MTNQTGTGLITNQKSIALRIKRVVGHRVWRVITRPIAFGLKLMPQSLVFKVGMALRKNSYPYCLITEGDTAIQVGAPADLLRIGRSRAVFFAMRVGASGHVFIFEPEPNSAKAMRDYLQRNGMKDRATVVEKGCWSSDRVLRFWSNPDHPASNLLEDVSKWDETELRARQYQPSEVPVTTIDGVLDAANVTTVKMVSITTNGSEDEILSGAEKTLAKADYLALAETGEEVHALAQSVGFRNMALDDRGFTAARIVE